MNLTNTPTKELQTQLKTLGFYKGSIDDIYGNQTAQAVVELQNVLSELNLYNFKSDGIFGKLTLEGLLEYQKILKIEQDNKDSKVLHTTNKLDYKQFLFGKVLSDSFLDSVYWIADQLKHTEVKAIDLANDLIACMHWESGGTFSPSIRNAAGSGACGLIQFMPSTAKALGTTTDKLAKMSQIEQLNYVYKYFLPYKGKLRNLGDVYMAILWPKAVGYSDTYVLWNKNKMPTTYRQNSGLDVNKDGTITRAECLVKIRERVVLGKKNMRKAA